jgi:hypothetical protein
LKGRAVDDDGTGARANPNHIIHTKTDIGSRRSQSQHQQQAAHSSRDRRSTPSSRYDLRRLLFASNEIKWYRTITDRGGRMDGWMEPREMFSVSFSSSSSISWLLIRTRRFISGYDSRRSFGRCFWLLMVCPSRPTDRPPHHMHAYGLWDKREREKDNREEGEKKEDYDDDGGEG